MGDHASSVFRLGSMISKVADMSVRLGTRSGMSGKLCFDRESVRGSV